MKDMTMGREERIYVFDDVVLEIDENRQAKLVIGPPYKAIPRKDAKRVAKKAWLRDQVRKALTSLHSKKPCEIRLAKSDSLLRIGGGFVQIENGKLLLVRRSPDAPSMPNALDICAGVFDEKWKNPLEMMIAESVEILRFIPDRDIIIFLIPSGLGDVLSRDAIEKEYYKATLAVFGDKKAREISFQEVNPIIIEPEQPIKVVYSDKELIDVMITFEIETSSIELIGIVEVPHRRNVTYSDGEYIEKNGLLLPLNREIHVINMGNLQDTIWRRFNVIRKGNFRKVVSETTLTSKARLVVKRLLNV